MGGTYAFEGRFRGQTSFGIMLASNGRYRVSSQNAYIFAYWVQSVKLAGLWCCWRFLLLYADGVLQHVSNTNAPGEQERDLLTLFAGCFWRHG